MNIDVYSKENLLTILKLSLNSKSIFSVLFYQTKLGHIEEREDTNNGTANIW